MRQIKHIRFEQNSTVYRYRASLRKIRFLSVKDKKWQSNPFRSSRYCTGFDSAVNRIILAARGDKNQRSFEWTTTVLVGLELAH